MLFSLLVSIGGVFFKSITPTLNVQQGTKTWKGSSVFVHRLDL